MFPLALNQELLLLALQLFLEENVAFYNNSKIFRDTQESELHLVFQEYLPMGITLHSHMLSQSLSGLYLISLPSVWNCAHKGLNAVSSIHFVSVMVCNSD